MTKSQQGFWKSFKNIFRFSTKNKNKSTKDISVKLGEDFILESEPSKLELKAEPTEPIRKKSEIIYIQVGLDFGTSFTKVVYSQRGRRGFYALSFKHNLPDYPNYCLPSLIASDQNQNLLFGDEAARFLSNKEWDVGFQRLKVIVAGKHDHYFRDRLTEKKFFNYRQALGFDDSLSPEKLTTLYLAYTMRKCRQILENSPEYKDSKLDIAFNICIPIEHIENNKVKVVFEDIFKNAEAIEIAWRIKGDDFNPMADFSLNDYFPDEADKRVFAVPEAVAGIASYLVSLRREDGLHAIIDLGAGTTDISICNLFSSQSEKESYWYSAKNIPWGTINIERLIAEYLKNYQKDTNECSYHNILNILDELKNPDFYKDETNQSKKQLFKKIIEEMNAFGVSKPYEKTWGNAYKHLKKQSKWENVEVFLSGGGSALNFAENVFSRPWWPQIRSEYKVSRLPIPDDYVQGDSNAPFERMTVAYGLSIPKLLLDKYILPKDSPDQTPPKLHYKLRDRDEIYAK